MDPNDTTTVMDLATYAATVASNTANLTSMSISPQILKQNPATSHQTVGAALPQFPPVSMTT